MRTTLTLDPDIARRLKEKAHRERVPFKVVVNETLRSGLDAAGTVRPAGRFIVEPEHCGLRPGVDAGKLNQLVDEMDELDFGRESSGGVE